MSTPTFDGAGNGWFIASAALDKIDPDTGEPFIDFDNVLVRAVRTELPGQTPSYGYELELVLELANIFGGVNSGLPYQIQFLDLSVSSGDDGRGTASPATIDHNNGRTWGWDNTDLDGIDPADPITNGGIVLSAEIVYDVDGDGDFEDPTGGGADPASSDQAYQTLLYVGYYDDAQGCNAADIALPFGILDLQDVNTFVSAFTSQDPLADIDDNGIFDLVDINSFANAFLAGCP
jgi:hypothetical protein